MWDSCVRILRTSNVNFLCKDSLDALYYITVLIVIDYSPTLMHWDITFLPVTFSRWKNHISRIDVSEDSHGWTTFRALHIFALKMWVIIIVNLSQQKNKTRLHHCHFYSLLVILVINNGKAFFLKKNWWNRIKCPLVLKPTAPVAEKLN